MPRVPSNALRGHLSGKEVVSALPIGLRMHESLKRQFRGNSSKISKAELQSVIKKFYPGQSSHPLVERESAVGLPLKLLAIITKSWLDAWRLLTSPPKADIPSGSSQLVMDR